MQRAGTEGWTCGMPEWCPGHQNHQRGQDTLQECSLCPSGSQWDNVLALECKAKANEAWDHQTFTEAFRTAVQAWLAWVPGGTTLPATNPYWWHTLSCHPEDVSHCPTVGCSEHRDGTNASHPKCVGDSNATIRWKMPAPLLQSKCTHL